jgi:hypothetical protein
MTIKGDNQFTQPGSYFFLVLLVVFLLLQMKLLNAGLERADALFVVPIYQVVLVCSFAQRRQAGSAAQRSSGGREWTRQADSKWMTRQACR